MFSLGSKSFFGVAGVSGVAGIVVMLASTDRAGVALLLMGAIVAAFVGFAALAATGPGDRASMLVGTQSPLMGRAPTASVAPLLAAAAAGAAIFGAALGPAAYALAGVVGLVALLAWFTTAWREHPNYVAAATPRISDRFSLPFGLPLAVLALIAIIVVSFSRILLSVSKNASTVVALVIAVVTLLGGILAAIRPKMDRRLVMALGALAAAAVITAGIFGIARGEREFEHHSTGAEHASEGEAGASDAGSATASTVAADAAEPAA